MENVHVVMNPNSGNQIARKLLPWLRLRLGGESEILSIEPGVDAAAWARGKAEAGSSRILVMGGDGTFRSVASALVGLETPVGLVPCGTNNNISSVLGMPADPYQAVEVALNADAQWMSAGRIGDYIFFEGAGIGLEADLWPIGEAIVRRKFRDILDAPLAFASDRPVDMLVEIDPPSDPMSVRAFTMTISNTPVTGQRLVLAPGIDIRDPLLFVTIYHDLGRLKLLMSGHAMHQGRKGHGFTTTRYPFMRLKAQSEYRFNVHADGTLIGKLPVEVVSIPKAIRVAMPVASQAPVAEPEAVKH